MKAAVMATSVEVQLELTQRELELCHALFSRLTGFQGEELSAVARSAEEWTSIAATLSRAFAVQVRQVTSRSGDQRGNPEVVNTR